MVVLKLNVRPASGSASTGIARQALWPECEHQNQRPVEGENWLHDVHICAVAHAHVSSSMHKQGIN